MKLTRLVCLLLVACTAPIAAAEVLQVNIYKPTPGAVQELHWHRELRLGKFHASTPHA